jgi:hypothetical protein
MDQPEAQAAVIAYGLPTLINHGCHWYDVAPALAGGARLTLGQANRELRVESFLWGNE